MANRIDPYDCGRWLFSCSAFAMQFRAFWRALMFSNRSSIIFSILSDFSSFNCAPRRLFNSLTFPMKAVNDLIASSSALTYCWSLTSNFRISRDNSSGKFYHPLQINDKCYFYILP